MVVGLAAAALQSAPVVTEDVDLWFEDLSDPKLSRALQALGAAYAPPFGPNPPMLAGPHSVPFDVVISMIGLGTFADEVKHARQIRVGRLRLKVLSLERIFASKTAANRPKDRTGDPSVAKCPPHPASHTVPQNENANCERTGDQAQAHSAAQPQPNGSAGLQPALNDQTPKADCKSALRPLRKILAAGERQE
ncbi:MAG: hypothetical protein ACYDH9_23280 [Limisphaerales bacterium]